MSLDVYRDQEKHITFAGIETRTLKPFLWTATLPQHDTATSLRLRPYLCIVSKTFDVF